MSNSTASNSGIGVTGLLGVVFIVLKLTGVIDWSWWWVLLPFWGPVAIVLLAVVTWLSYLIYKVYQDKKKRKNHADI